MSYICNRLTVFEDIWYGGAHWYLTVNRPLKFQISENPTWRRPPSWTSQKITISLQWFDRSLRNLVRRCKRQTFLRVLPTRWRQKTAGIWIEMTSLSLYVYGRQLLSWESKNCYYSVSHWHSGIVMVGNITFLTIFAVFELSPLTLTINCSF